MALTAHLSWNCLDDTIYWNDRLRTRSNRGIFAGGLITTVPGSLTIEVGGDFAAVSFDGMVVRDEAGVPTTLAVYPNLIQWVVCYAKYQDLNPNPILAYQVLPDATYAAHIDQDYLIVLARIVLGPLAIDVQPGDIDYTVRDAVDPLGRWAYRGTVALVANLPVAVPTENRDGDVYYVRTEGRHYAWDSGTSTWNIVPADLLQNSYADAIFEQAYIQRTRREELSGVIPGDFTSTVDRRLPVVQVSNIADRLDIRNVTAVANGHFVYTPYTIVTLTPKPGVGTRWDGIWLEVWREEIAQPSTLTFPEAPGGGGTKTVAQIIRLMETMQQSGDNDGNSAYVYSVENVEDGHWVATFYQIRSVASLAVTAYQSPVGLMSDPAVTNLGGNPFGQAIPPGGLLEDQNVWFANYIAAYDGVSWGIPLLVVRRVPAEDATVNQAIKFYRDADDGLQQIFDVYPYTRTAYNDRIAKGTSRSLLPTANNDVYNGLHDIWNKQAQLPSGVLRGWHKPMTGRADVCVFGQFAPLSNALRVPAMTVCIRGNILTVPAASASLAAAPLIGARRELVVLTFRVVKYPTADSLWGANPPEHLKVTDEYGHTYFVFLQYETYDVGMDLTEADAMVTAGFTPVLTASTSTSNLDDGLWYAMDPDAEFRVPLESNFYAIPVALIARRNQTAFSPFVNPNGGSGRPDTFTHDVVELGDVLDLRHRICTNKAELAGIVEESIDAMLQGRLRTAMVEHPIKAGIAGTTHMYEDALTQGGGVTPGFYDIPAPMDGIRGIWSEAVEYYPACISYTCPGGGTIAYNDPDGLVDIVWPGVGPADITITAPAGSYLYEDPGAPLEAVFLDGAGPWTWNNPNSATQFPPLVNWANPPGWQDLLGRSTRLTCQIAAPVPAALFGAGITHSYSIAVVYDRSNTIAPYTDNRGLYAVPDRSLEYDTDTWGPIQNRFPLAYIKKPAEPGPTVTFTQLELQGAVGTADTVIIPGIPFSHENVTTNAGNEPLDSYQNCPHFNIVGRDTQSYVISAVDRDPITHDVTITTIPPILNEDIELIFPYVLSGAAAPSYWMDMGRGSKSIHGLYGWLVCNTFTSGAPNVFFTAKAFTEPSVGLHNHHSLLRRQAGDIDVFVWYDNGGKWTQMQHGAAHDYIVDPLRQALLYNAHYGPVLQIQDLLGLAPGTNLQVFAVAWIPPESSETEIRINYLGTPYNGTLPIVGTTYTQVENQLTGWVESTSDVIVGTQGPGVSRFNGIAELPAVQEFILRTTQEYAGINPALVYLPELKWPNWSAYDNRDYGAAYFYIPMPDTTVAGGTCLPWQIDGEQLQFNDLQNEVNIRILRMALQDQRISSLVGELYQSADKLKPEILIEAPNGIDTALITVGEANGGIEQGVFFANPSPTQYVREIAAPCMGRSHSEVLRYLYDIGAPLIDANGLLYNAHCSARPHPVTVECMLTTAYGTPGHYSLVGYIVRTPPSKITDVTGHRALMLAVYADKHQGTVMKTPGAAFDAFMPLYRPLLPRQSEEP